MSSSSSRVDRLAADAAPGAREHVAVARARPARPAPSRRRRPSTWRALRACSVKRLPLARTTTGSLSGSSTARSSFARASAPVRPPTSTPPTLTPFRDLLGVRMVVGVDAARADEQQQADDGGDDRRSRGTHPWVRRW